MRFMLLCFILLLPYVQGQSLPSGEEIRAKVIETYRAPKRCLMSGIVSGQSPRLASISTPVTIAFDLPDKMYMKGGNLPSSAGLDFQLIVLNGKKAWMYNPDKKQYIYRSDAPDSRQMISHLENLTFIRYRGLLKPNGTASFLRMDKLQVKGTDIDCYVVQIDRGNFESKDVGSARNTWWVDKNSYLIWKEDNIEWISKSGEQEIQTTIFDSVLLDKPFSKNYFVFKPPKDAIQLPLPTRQPNHGR
jgi:outer membrane lipoprotein-sorting protein